MSNQELMGRYWEVSIAARLVSLAFQKWMGSLVGMISAWSAIRHDLPLLWHIIFNILYKVCVLVRLRTHLVRHLHVHPPPVCYPRPFLCLCWSKLWGRTHSKSKQQHFRFIQNLNYFISEHLPSWGQAADIPVYQWTAHCYECLQPHSVLLHYRQGKFC